MADPRLLVTTDGDGNVSVVLQVGKGAHVLTMGPEAAFKVASRINDAAQNAEVEREQLAAVPSAVTLPIAAAEPERPAGVPAEEIQLVEDTWGRGGDLCPSCMEGHIADADRKCPACAYVSPKLRSGEWASDLPQRGRRKRASAPELPGLETPAPYPDGAKPDRRPRGRR